MESWKQGRGEFFEQLNNAYDQIGEKIALELNSDKFARIRTEELRILRETSASVQKLAESHGRLTDELEVCREAVAKVEQLEKENTRLAHELQAKLKQESIPLEKSISPIQCGNHVDLTPGSSELRSNAAQIEPGETKQSIQRKYEGLISKYNRKCRQLDSMTEALEHASNYAKAEKIKCQDWVNWAKNTKELLVKKDESIRKLKGEITLLKSQLGGPEYDSEDGSDSDQQLEAVTDIQNEKPPALDIAEAQVQVPASSPPKIPHPGLAADNPGPNLGYSGAHDDHGHPNEPELELPTLPAQDTSVGDTGSEPLEAHHTSSTEGDPDPVLPENPIGEDVVGEPEPETKESSSLAVFISSRSVKKRKTRHQKANEADGPKIKTEVIELSSPHTLVPEYINSGESMDLDEIGEKVSTPRKAQKVSKHVSRVMANSQTSNLSCSQSQTHISTSTTSAPILQVTPARRETTVLQPRSVNTSILPRTSDDTGRAPKKRKMASDQAVAEVSEDGEMTLFNRRLKGQTSNGNELLTELLTKPSPDKQVISPKQTRPAVRPSTSILSAFQKPSSRVSLAPASALAHEVLKINQHKEPEPPNLIAGKIKSTRGHTPDSRPLSARVSHEPDHPTAPPSKKSMAAGPVDVSRPSSGQLLKSSAESFRPSPKTSARSSKEPSMPDEGVSRRSPSSIPGTQLPARRNLASAFVSRTVNEIALVSPRTPNLDRPGRPATTTAKKRQIRTEEDYGMDPSQEPLRARPLSKLSLTDFKINPNYNQGYNFAFNEVVRGKQARACLEGCIKPGCCGDKLRGLAREELALRRTSLSQEERDEALLEDYLGDGADRIKYMSKAEKEETLLQAKTREIANKHGRHRHAYDRGATPPGFWRTDFPTTQEELEDREIGKGKEREVVKQRYLQAMRAGGAYLFRDE